MHSAKVFWNSMSKNKSSDKKLIEIKDKKLPIVAIGVLSEYIGQVIEFLEALSPNAGFVYIIAICENSDNMSAFTKILAREYSCPVCLLESAMPLKPNHIYVIAKRLEVSFTDNGRLLVEPNFLINNSLQLINSLFNSVANCFGKKAIGVLFVESEHDSIESIAKLREVGGAVFLSAKSGLSAKILANSNALDILLSPKEIAGELSRLVRRSHMQENDFDRYMESIDTHLIESQILALIREETGVDFSHYKQSTLHRRLRRRLAINKIDSIEQYYKILKSDSSEVNALYRDFLINVTSFFRNEEIFEALTTIIFPKIVQGKSLEEPIRVWVPGCSTGEEVYTIAILLLEFLGKKSLQIPIQIFGTDISAEVIEKARTGIYSADIASEVSQERLKRFFVRIDNGYQIKKSIREVCIFARHNLISDPPLAKMDLISCRNLLIYFGQLLQQRAIPLLHYALKSTGGFLLLGKSEVIDLFTELFVCVDKTHKFYARRSSSIKIPIEFSTGVRMPPKSQDKELASVNRNGGIDLKREVDRLIVANFSPSGVLINENMDILQFRGDTSLFIAPSSGRASLNLLKIVHQDLLTELKFAVDEAKSNGGLQVRRKNIPIRQHEDILIRINIRIVPIRESNLRERYFFIVFEKYTDNADRCQTSDEQVNYNEIKRLHEELQATRQYLQTVIDERETSTEELQSANEEIISANEELQTINQELETSKEELESANEELTTVNEELRIRIEELRLSEERFRILVSGVKDYAIFMLDKDGIIRSWNSGAQRITGYHSDEIIGKHFSIFYTKEDIKDNKPKKELRLAIEQGAYTEEAIRLKKDRTRFWACVVLTPVYDSAGQLYGFAKITRDISEQKATQDRIRESEERFRLLVTAIKDYAIIMLDPQGYVNSWNSGAERILGYKSDEILGRHFSCFFPSEAFKKNLPQKELAVALQNGRYEEENIRIKKDGFQFWANIIIVPLFDSEGQLQGFAKVIRDISDQKKMQRIEAEKTAAELASQAKSSFLANISHELRTPLSAIVGFSELLEQESSIPAQTLECIKSIQRNSKHLSSLVSGILDLSKIEANQMDVEKVEISLTEEVKKILSLFLIQAKEKGLEINLTYTSLVPKVIHTDPTRFMQILVNIIGNAIKFTDSGYIDIAINLSEQSGKHRLIFTVSDTGCGIASDYQEKIFKPFEQAGISKNYGGTGLGLSLSRQLVKLLGGDIILKSSALGRGSVFEISIDPGDISKTELIRPDQEISIKTSETSDKKLSIDNKKMLQGIRVLLVEDTIDSQNIFKRHLKSEGAIVSVANNGEEGVQMALKDDFDVILMDMRMPILDGCEATKKLRDQNVMTPIIAFTAHATKEERDRSLSAGCDDYLTKPVNGRELCQAVAHWSGKTH